ncbi:GPW/gp25 family protein [Pseudomonas syringae]|uniref:IraD/Gp25-like domain-containing protein n=3 Tax=Pseudomonas syringae group TaxID=136849 RepID=A0A9Q4A632_PSESX|nr:GPW/gp25 family protein [Pseudomonas syringae]KTB65399.1 hypothetical protein AO067_23425 [Pseudomonas viridiflava ICMP 13104]KTB84748.1 hypothetical protein AO070_01040 [Pseudomonas syringae pv. syringae PD2766]MCF5467833.1 hypothetical protein [Pseudomonas syringae]MCF5472358.1 hypothetical protein [Pseudomonas syringae]MCF5481664.1 hypothetical protein [Pseudomonas syringae]
MEDSSFLGSGWSYPIVFEDANLQLRMSAAVENINQSIHLLLNTPIGSRSLLPDYGSKLSTFLFRHIDATAQEEIIQSVTFTLLNGEPRIDVENVRLSVNDGGATVEVFITYVVRQTNARHNHVFPFSSLEGSNLEVTG